MRYRLQRKEPVAMPCVIGNHSMPLPSYRWKDIAGSDNLELLREHARGMNPKTHRIEDIKDGSVISI